MDGAAAQIMEDVHAARQTNLLCAAVRPAVIGTTAARKHATTGEASVPVPHQAQLAPQDQHPLS